MIEKLDDYLVGIAIGVKYRVNFSVEDQLGSILDSILYSKDSYFNYKVFPRVGGTLGKRILINEKTDDQLRIDNTDIILEIQFGFDNGFSKSDYPTILRKFDENIINGVMVKFGIHQISRIGLIKRYLFPIEDLAKTFVDKTVGRTLEGVNDINLRFSKRMPVPEAFVKQNVNDWSNAIFNIIKKADTNDIFMSVDYQLYYQPYIDKPSQVKFSVFTESVETFNKKRYLPWLNTNYIGGTDDK
jgi:hypothetical protein